MFDLFFISNSIDELSKSIKGCIFINHQNDYFLSSLHYWKEDDYKKSWKKSLEILFNENYSIILTDVNNPNYVNYFFGYNVFILDQEIYFQQKIFFSKDYSLQNILNLNLDKKSSLTLISEEGNKISTWKCPIESILNYYKKL